MPTSHSKRFAAHILIGQCQPSTPSSTSPSRRPVPNNVSRSFVPLLVGEPSTRRPGLCCTQLQPSTSSSTLPHRRPVPDTVSLSFVPILVVPWSSLSSGKYCNRRPSSSTLPPRRPVPDNVSWSNVPLSRIPRLRHCLIEDLFPTHFRCCRTMISV